MKKVNNHVIEGKHNKPILLDMFYTDDEIPKPIVIFCHGYKGFKDWGAWNLLAEQFAKAGFCFVKFNFSHNGGTPEQPIDFPDLEAFGNNNYTKELDDLGTVIDWITTSDLIQKNANTENITLIGHSRGGGITLIKASEDFRIKSVISLASVSNYENRFGELEQWKKDGVKYITNGRTKQQMPHYYQFYEDFLKNKERLNIKSASENLSIPHLIIHGDNDTSVSINEAHNLHQWNPKSELNIIEYADHVFNTKHPWQKSELSNELNSVFNLCKNFLSKI